MVASRAAMREMTARVIIRSHSSLRGLHASKVSVAAIRSFSIMQFQGYVGQGDDGTRGKPLEVRQVAVPCTGSIKDGKEVKLLEERRQQDNE
jgi:hypothetical protein